MSSLIYLPQCSSTQNKIIDFIKLSNLGEDFLAVYTFDQTLGRGQYGNLWEILPHENLAFSFAIKTNKITYSDILFNYYTAILVRNFIANLTQTVIKIKWPNDIIIKNKKICGMLFEKKGDYLVGGIGINVLQKNFENLPNAGSIFTETLLAFDLKTLAEAFYSYISGQLLKGDFPKDILEIYNANLYKRHEISVFEKKGIRQNGIIKNADINGHLWVELENEGLQKFYHKEITLCY